MNLLHLLFALFAAAPVETWECRDYMESGWNNIIVVATIDEDRTTGSIEVAGTTQETIYHVEGFNRRWDFGREKGGGYSYSFLIKPDGTGLYYDFTRADTAVKASMVMECRQRKS